MPIRWSHFCHGRAHHRVFLTFPSHLFTFVCFCLLFWGGADEGSVHDTILRLRPHAVRVSNARLCSTALDSVPGPRLGHRVEVREHWSLVSRSHILPPSCLLDNGNECIRTRPFSTRLLLALALLLFLSRYFPVSCNSVNNRLLGHNVTSLGHAMGFNLTHSSELTGELIAQLREVVE